MVRGVVKAMHLAAALAIVPGKEPWRMCGEKKAHTLPRMRRVQLESLPCTKDPTTPLGGLQGEN